MQDRVQKTKDEVQKCREKYEQSLQEINKYNPIYMEDMTSVFYKCQELEETRLRFFKNVLFSIHKTLNISQDPTWVTLAVIGANSLFIAKNVVYRISACLKSMTNSITQSTTRTIRRTSSGGRTTTASTWQWTGLRFWWVRARHAETTNKCFVCLPLSAWRAVLVLHFCLYFSFIFICCVGQ